jgi:hypothetical protein
MEVFINQIKMNQLQRDLGDLIYLRKKYGKIDTMSKVNNLEFEIPANLLSNQK